MLISLLSNSTFKFFSPLRKKLHFQKDLKRSLKRNCRKIYYYLKLLSCKISRLLRKTCTDIFQIVLQDQSEITKHQSAHIQKVYIHLSKMEKRNEKKAHTVSQFQLSNMDGYNV